MNTGQQLDWGLWMKRFEKGGNVPPTKVTSSQSILRST
jgi:hypothetical protein